MAARFDAFDSALRAKRESLRMPDKHEQVAEEMRIGLRKFWPMSEQFDEEVLAIAVILRREYGEDG